MRYLEPIMTRVNPRVAHAELETNNKTGDS